MGLNETPSANRLHISLFGKRNAGKSSLMNALTGQSLAIVSEIKGTTTDPVSKTMELLPLGPVVMTDTPGLDDDSELGAQRIEKSLQILRKTDIALLVTEAAVDLSAAEKDVVAKFQAQQIPYLIVHNKMDIRPNAEEMSANENEIWVSSKTGEHIRELKEKLGTLKKAPQTDVPIVADLVNAGDIVVLIMPQDSAAPKGRLILPQQQTIRELLDVHAIPVVIQPEELQMTLEKLTIPPKLVITDSQVFKMVAQQLPAEIMLTSFSILFARHKGLLQASIAGVAEMRKLTDGDTVLISEGCTHHRQCEDIGTVKLPKWITEKTGKNLIFETTSGGEFPAELKNYQLIVHCGGCMLNGKEMGSRLRHAQANQIPMTNYGIVIAYVNGILARTLAPFPDLQKLID